MKIFAGLKLKIRNPLSAPTNIRVRSWRIELEVKNDNVRPAIMPIPAARPSMLSNRLNALVIPTIQTTVKQTLTQLALRSG